MFRKYGFIGIILIVLIEINFFLKIEPFASWYFPLIWLGYILTIDALIYDLSDNMENRTICSQARGNV